MPINSIIAVGDVLVDYITTLNAPDLQSLLEGISSGTNLFAPINVLVGGAALQFALAAKQSGFKSSKVMSKIGGHLSIPDLPGSLIFDFLNKNNIEHLLAIDPKSETGRTLIIYLPSDKRLMISNPLASSLFSPSDVTTEMIASVRQG